MKQIASSVANGKRAICSLLQQFPELGYTGVLWLGKGGKAGIFQE
jgi:hypothetical protein